MCHPSHRLSSPGTYPTQLLVAQTSKYCCSKRTCSSVCPRIPCPVWAVVLSAWWKNTIEKVKNHKMKYFRCPHLPGLVLPVSQEQWVQAKSMLGCAGRGDAGAGATRGSRNSFSLGACSRRISHAGWDTGDTLISRGIFPNPHVKH